MGVFVIADHQLHKKIIKTQWSYFGGFVVLFHKCTHCHQGPLSLHWNIFFWNDVSCCTCHLISKENYFIICFPCLSHDIQAFFLNSPGFVPETIHKNKHQLGYLNTWVYCEWPSDNGITLWPQRTYLFRPKKEATVVFKLFDWFCFSYLYSPGTVL